MKDLKTIRNIIDANRDLLERRYKVKLLELFGSYAKGSARKKSDLDILVEFYQSPDFF